MFPEVDTDGGILLYERKMKKAPDADLFKVATLAAFSPALHMAPGHRPVSSARSLSAAGIFSQRVGLHLSPRQANAPYWMRRPLRAVPERRFGLALSGVVFPDWQAY